MVSGCVLHDVVIVIVGDLERDIVGEKKKKKKKRIKKLVVLLSGLSDTRREAQPAEKERLIVSFQSFGKTVTRVLFSLFEKKITHYKFYKNILSVIMCSGFMFINMTSNLYFNDNQV